MAKLERVCDPLALGTLAEHSDADVLGTGALDQQIDAMNLEALCESFSDIATLDGAQAWLGCIAEAAICGARQSLLAAYPRTVEWMTELRTGLAVAAAAGDDAALDARDELDDLLSTLDPDGDLSPNPSCRSNGSCSNGSIDVGEQCDGGDLGGADCQSLGYDDGALRCGADCGYDTGGCFFVKKIFVTAVGYRVPSDFSSLIEADSICQGLADAAGLTGGGSVSFKAWLSDDDQSAIDRIAGASEGSFIDTTGRTVKRGGLGDGQPLAYGIVRDASGVEWSGGSDRVWTATDRFGVKRTSNCRNWVGDVSPTSVYGAISGVAGSVHSERWTDAMGAAPCSAARRLYCVEER